MFPTDASWVYLIVPAVLVFILILIKLRQKEMAQIRADDFPHEDAEKKRVRKDKAEHESLTGGKRTEAKPETTGETKPQGCNNYLGYLYMKKAPRETQIPTECYNCSNLLKCLYSPVVVEKVYGE